MDLNLNLNRLIDGSLRPYTQEEFLGWLIKESTGVDVLEKTKPRLLGDSRKVTCTWLGEDTNPNTRIDIARVDADGDIDDTTLEVFYYNRVNVTDLKMRQFPSFPVVRGGAFDVPVGTPITKKHIAECLTSLFWIEFKEENINVSDNLTLTTKPYMELAVKLAIHPMVAGTVDIVFYSPSDGRPTKTFDLGTVETEEGTVSTTIQSYSTLMLTQPQNDFERDAIRERNRLPRHLGD